jgi:RNA polymerase sigma factor (sigma-70 family)
MRRSSDKRLVRRSLSGDPKAFEQLVKNHERLVTHVVCRMIRAERDREDICQEVFIKVYQNLSNFKFRCRLSTWIATIAFNTCRNHLEKRRVPLYEDIRPEEDLAADIKCDRPSPEDHVQSNDIAEHVRRQIEKLPVHYRTVLTLYHLENMSYNEISEITKMPEGTVKNYLFRARRLLKERLTAHYRPEELWKEAI